MANSDGKQPDHAVAVADDMEDPMEIVADLRDESFQRTSFQPFCSEAEQTDRQPSPAAARSSNLTPAALFAQLRRHVLTETQQDVLWLEHVRRALWKVQPLPPPVKLVRWHHRLVAVCVGSSAQNMSQDETLPPPVQLVRWHNRLVAVCVGEDATADVIYLDSKSHQ
mmetsp:Transcript_75060/g.178464  ORF Transcript_75060/g.178464 Transcript_75060/m.178464 type:complete len:167 (-) Transcript_75060:202-702(-)